MSSSYYSAIEKIELALTVKKNHFKKWLVVADRYLKYYSNGKYERHLTAEDVVQELITKILEGKRNWNPEKQPDFDQFMFLNIRSIVEGKFRARNKVESVEDFYPDNSETGVKHNFNKNLIAENEDPADAIDRNDKIEECYNEILDDEDAALVFLEWKKGKTSRQIAEELGMEVAEVERCKKRIIYKLNKKFNQ